MHLNNIMIDKNNEPFLIDFEGLIKFDDQKTQNIQKIELPEIDSCELLTYKFDILQLGYIIYYILYETNPTKNNTEKILFYCIPKELPESSKIFSNFFQIDPRNRPTIGQAIEKFYNNFLKMCNSEMKKEPKLIKLFENNTLKMDDIYCLLTIGSIYEKGDFVSRDISKAIYYYELSADKGYIYAFPEIGRIYKDGKLVPRDLYKAFHSYSFSALINSDYEKDFDDIKKELGYGPDYIKFQELPIEYETMKNNIMNELIQKMYSCFNFSYYKFPNNDDRNLFIYEDNLFSYLQNFKFLVYDIINSPYNVNVIICIEKRCIIVEEIKFKKIKTIFDQFIREGNKIIKIPSKDQEYVEKDINHIKEEIKNFQRKFNYKIGQNEFVDWTISTILVFLVRRFFCPTKYFKDQTFFNFHDDKSNEKEIKLSIQKQLNPNKEKVDDKISFVKNLSKIDDKISNESKQKKQNLEFQKGDFIILRTILNKGNASFNLVIHCGSLHIFMMKKVNELDDFKHEIDFCSNYHHRCLTPFYGFVKDKNKEKIIGFIYEYMSNDNLCTFLTSMPDKQNNIIFIMTSIIRIFEGIEYLHSNSLIHRDIKPANILIDHDYLPYISDYYTIRYLDESDTSTSMTNDLGSLQYTSPEQDNGVNVSYPTDIFSFGLVLYYIFKKKNLFDACQSNIIDTKKNIASLPKIDSSSKIQEIFDKCVKYKLSERMKLNEIKLNIINDIQSFDFFEQCLIQSSSFDFFDLKSSLIYEIMLFFYYNSENRNKSQNCLYETIYWFEIGSFYKLHYPERDFLMYMGIIYENINPIKANYLKAKKYYELATKKNNAYAFEKLGDLYYFGKGVEQDYLEAKKYYEQSASLDNSNAFVKLGDLYYYGKGVQQDYLKTIKYYEIAAKKNNSNAFIKLGDLYYFGKGVEQNYIKAKEYYELATDLNNSLASEKLGDLYYFGKGADQDYLKAKKYYEQSADLDNSYAILKLGNLYYYGFGIKQDYLKAKEYYESSAKKNNSNAFVKLGDLYYYGKGVQQDYLKTIKYYEIAAKKNNSDAFIKLGNLYYYGKGVEQNYIKAKEYYESATRLDDFDAYVNLGNIYYNGKGVKQDLLKAKECYEKAAKYNNLTAIQNLGSIYRKGFGVPQDFLKAKEYYEIAAQQNDSFSILQLGDLYRNGQGVTKNILKAKDYYELSSKIGNCIASNKLGDMYFNGEGVEKDYLKAKSYYQLSAEIGNSEALFKLGNIYYHGFGVERDYKKAIKFYELSSEQNNPDALFFLGNFYSSNEITDINIPKSIDYYQKCSNIENGNIIIPYSKKNQNTMTFQSNKYRDRARNDLGLIYLLTLKEKESEGIKYIKESAFSEYPFGQNNYGLINQFYFKNIEKAEHYYERSSKHQFALSEYNLGYMKEILGKIEESIEYYIRASEDEDHPLIFRDIEHDDIRLSISKTFIICFTNLKLVEYFFIKGNYDESKRYFVKSLSKLQLIRDDFVYQFQFPFDYENAKNCFTYLKSFIINFPLFNLKKNMKFIINRSVTIENNKETDNNNNNNNKFNNTDKKEISDKEKNIISKEEEKCKIKIFYDSGELFDFCIVNKDLKEFFIEEIKEIMNYIHEILYTPPYSILFGRISIEKQKESFIESDNPNQKETNELFYEGFNKE